MDLRLSLVLSESLSFMVTSCRVIWSGGGK